MEDWAGRGIMSPLGTARSHGSTGELINHFTGIRMRIVGSGELEMSLLSQDAVRSIVLTPFTMSATARINPFRLASFVEQRVQLEGKTDTINETFRINRIVIYAKPLWTEEPG